MLSDGRAIARILKDDIITCELPVCIVEQVHKAIYLETIEFRRYMLVVYKRATLDESYLPRIVEKKVPEGSIFLKTAFIEHVVSLVLCQRSGNPYLWSHSKMVPMSRKLPQYCTHRNFHAVIRYIHI
jgi:hypothetical protein